MHFDEKSRIDRDVNQMRSRNHHGLCVDGLGDPRHDEENKNRKLLDSVTLEFWNAQSERIHSLLSSQTRKSTVPAA